MTEILISNQAYHERRFNRMCGESLQQQQCSGQHGITWPYEPYATGSTSRQGTAFIRPLLCGSPRNIHELSATLGQDHIVGVSDIMAKLHDNSGTLAGSTASVYSARGNEFTASVQRYQNALLAYRDVVHGKGAAHVTKASAGQAIHAAFANMQQRFQYELRMTSLSQKGKPRKGTPLNNSSRAMNIARSSRNIQKLQLTTTTQAGALGRFSRYGKVLGTGLVAVDFASRIGNVHNAYKADGNWERDLFVESSSFVASAWAGTLVIKAGIVFVVVATPAGWVGLIVTAAAASMGANYIVKEEGGGIYDSIMKWLDTL